MQAKAYKGIGMEGRLAHWYATSTRKALKDFQSLARRLADTLAPGSRVLEVAPGPGYFSIELAKLGEFRITGLDISKTFVEIATKNAEQEGVEVDFHHGNVSAMPFPADSFDLIVCRAAFKNFSEPVNALQEMHRVLAPGGKALIIDMRRDASPQDLDALADQMKLGVVNSLITKWTFRLFLVKRAYTRDQFVEFIADSGFRQSDIQETPTGFEISLTK